MARKVLRIISLFALSSTIIACSHAEEELPTKLKNDPFFLAYGGYFEPLKSLLKDNPDLVKARNERGGTLLHSAASGNCPEIIHFLVERGADVNAQTDTTEETPLHDAANQGTSFEAAKALIELGADVNARPGFTAEEPIEESDDNVVSKGYGRSVLEVAASSGDYRLVDLLIKKGAKVEEKCFTAGNALHYACSPHLGLSIRKYPENVGNHKVIELLTRHIDINTRDISDRTPLHYAATYGELETVKYLVSHYKNIDLNATDDSGNTPLHLAARQSDDKENADIIRTLIKAGAYVNIINHEITNYKDFTIERLTPQQIAEKYDRSMLVAVFKAVRGRETRLDDNWPPVSFDWAAEQLWTLRHDEGVYAVCFSPDGKLLLTAGGDLAVRLWDVATGRELEKSEGKKAWDFVWDIAWSPDSRYALIAAGQYKGTERLTLWDVRNWQEVRRFERHQSPVRRVAFSPDGRRAVSGTSDGDVFAWDVQTGQQVSHYQPEVGRNFFSKSEADPRTQSLDISPDGRFGLWAGGYHNYQLRLFDISTGHELKSFEPKERHRGPTSVVGAIFTRDGSRILAASDRGYLRVWNIDQGSSSADVRIFREVFRKIESVAFSPDDRLVLVGSYDGELTLWQIEDIQQDMPSAKRLLYLQSPHDASERSNRFGQVTAGITRVALAPGYAAAADHDGMVRIWKVYKKESPDE